MMKTELESPAEPGRAGWLQSAGQAGCRDRIWKLGLLTGLKADDAGAFTPANFEQALVRDRLMRTSTGKP